MPTNTYVALRTTTVGTAVSSVVFDLTGITGYTDLVLVSSNITTSSGAGFAAMQFNGDTGSNYGNTYMTGTGSTASSGRATGSVIYFIGDTDTTNATMAVTHINNYSNTTTYKPVISRCGYASSTTQLITSSWIGTPAAITSITLTCNANFNTGCTFSLYGIAATSVGAKATGGDIYTDSLYYYHVFDSSSVFTPSTSLSCEYLVVAGGGGGGKANQSEGYSGGGGAGGLRSATATLSATNYTVTVGAGGSGSSANTSKGTNGVASSFNALATTGGGGGCSSQNPGLFTGSTGGSGGGSGGTYGPAAGNAGGYSPVEGYAGGQGDAAGSAGGGGGAGGVGQNGTTVKGGDGGVGSSSYSAWVSATGIGQIISGISYIAGGGGGSFYAGSSAVIGVGGAGGGGAAGNSGATPVNGIANTGSGGGAAGSSGSTNGATGGNGASGVVIVRYLKA